TATIRLHEMPSHIDSPAARAPTGTCHNILTRTCCQNPAYTSYPRSRGQTIIIVPSQDLVIVRTGFDDEAGGVFFQIDQLTRDVVDALPPR
ncbi:MAG: hypothetical protein VX975_00045, partial [Acidobacteriota bacterium]|nr:hypothetical protein [Acidobacteriota bacterium]